MSHRFRGSLVALPTPFCGGHAERIDYPALGGLIEEQLAAGTEALVIAGTTGEAATLEPRERYALAHYACGVAYGRVPILLGVGTNDTAETLRLTAEAACAGADGILVVAPFYNRPQQRGLHAHFARVAASTTLPVVLYNIPKRTGIDLEPATVAALAEEHENIVAIKETVCTEERYSALTAAGLDVLIGEDSALANGMQWGASGAVSVVGNLRPRRVAELLRCAAPEADGGDSERAAALVEELSPLVRALGLETNPTPLKHALAHLGRATGEVRLPLVSVDELTAREVETALAAD